ncbi:MAG: DUF2852 domain-containing protein [Hyphomicrobiaceae bacterium]
MPKHVMLIWLMAGGGTLLGAAMTYVAKRQPVAATGRHAVAGAGRMRSWLVNRLRAGAERSNTPGGGYRNSAYEAYRADVLRRRADEELEFRAFLDRMRAARDKEEFDAFLAKRRSVTRAPVPPAGSRPTVDHSHSIVPGGFEVTS